jgi:hypothetical protein
MGFGTSLFFAFLPFVELKHIEDDQYNSSDQKQNLEKLDHGASFITCEVKCLKPKAKRGLKNLACTT